MTPDASKIETPASQKPTASEPRIFTMPEKYRGLAATQKPSAPPVSQPAVPTTASLSLPKPSIPTPGVGLKKKKMSGSTKALLVAGAILIVGLSGAGVYVYLSLQPTVQRESETLTEKPTTTPEPETEVEKPKEEVALEEPPKEDEPSSPFPTELSPGRDTDSDGLTDLEEALYGTNTRLPDTDADGFLDGNEVFHRYNPRGTAPGTLLESGLVTLHEALMTENGFSVLYPTVWSVSSIAGEILGAVFVAPSAESITVSTETKSASLSLADWYASAIVGADVSELTAGTTKNSYPSLTAEDQMTTYVDLGDSVVTVSYQVVVKSTIDFLQTFQMMVNSISVVSSQ